MSMRNNFACRQLFSSSCCYGFVAPVIVEKDTIIHESMHPMEEWPYWANVRAPQEIEMISASLSRNISPHQVL